MYGWMYDESLRKEELQDAIPILSFAGGAGLSLKIRPLRDNAVDKMASTQRGQRVDCALQAQMDREEWRRRVLFVHLEKIQAVCVSC